MARAKDLLALISKQSDQIATLSDQLVKLADTQQTLAMRVTLLEGRDKAHTRLADIEKGIV